MGIYNKLVKLQRHDQEARGESTRASEASGVSSRPLTEEEAAQQSLPGRGYARSA
jgi:hypothetical protein